MGCGWRRRFWRSLTIKVRRGLLYDRGQAVEGVAQLLYNRRGQANAFREKRAPQMGQMEMIHMNPGRKNFESGVAAVIAGGVVGGRIASMRRGLLLIAAILGASASHGQAVTKHQAVLLHLTDQGFDPPQLTHRQGLVTLIVFNSTRGHDISLVVEQTIGALAQGASGAPFALANTPVPKETRDYRGVFNFSPGSYVIRDSRNPDWRCRLTITAN